ncbi:hypothetical protein [Clostridium sp. UBA1056]|uniref:hypothetical protein n=1 Tax=unclassified Clostridium TaxID=2614128 RepID=UPI003217A2CF
MVRVILNSNIIKKSDYIYDLDLNTLRKFEGNYFAKNEERPFELYKVSDKVIDQLILEFTSSVKESIDSEEYDDAREIAETLQNLCELKDSNIDKVKLW